MFCKYCGKELPDGTKFCPECGANLKPEENTIHTAANAKAPQNYMILGILTTVFCCLVFGIISIVYASRVDSYWNAGNREAAMEFSRKAKSWAIWGIVSAIIIYILPFVLIIAGVIFSDYGY